MPYDATKDPLWPRNGESFGRKGTVGVGSDTVDLTTPAKSVVTLATGDISVLPIGNDDAAPVAFVGVPAGFVVPYRVRRVMATGTTAAWATVED